MRKWFSIKAILLVVLLASHILFITQNNSTLAPNENYITITDNSVTPDIDWPPEW